MGTLVADGLFRSQAGRVRLLAGLQRKSGRVVFPFPEGTEGESYEQIELPAEGMLWTWTVQRFRPKPPFNGSDSADGFRPYVVGYIEFPGLLIVQGRVRVKELSLLRIGTPMRSVAEPYRVVEDGSPIVTYAFEPVDQA